MRSYLSRFAGPIATDVVGDLIDLAVVEAMCDKGLRLRPVSQHTVQLPTPSCRSMAIRRSPTRCGNRGCVRRQWPTRPRGLWRDLVARRRPGLKKLGLAIYGLAALAATFLFLGPASRSDRGSRPRKVSADVLLYCAWGIPTSFLAPCSRIRRAEVDDWICDCPPCRGRLGRSVR